MVSLSEKAYRIAGLGSLVALGLFAYSVEAIRKEQTAATLL
jgi:hypothetical protein